jgi:hypothetical protein
MRFADEAERLQNHMDPICRQLGNAASERLYSDAVRMWDTAIPMEEGYLAGDYHTTHTPITGEGDEDRYQQVHVWSGSSDVENTFRHETLHHLGYGRQNDEEAAFLAGVC